MSEPKIELPELHPVRLQGTAYRQAVRMLLAKHGEAIYRDAMADKMTPRKLCELALTYRIQLKVIGEYLEDRGVLRVGTYERVFKLSKNLRPIATLKQVWSEMQAAKPCELEQSEEA